MASACCSRIEGRPLSFFSASCNRLEAGPLCFFMASASLTRIEACLLCFFRVSFSRNGIEGGRTFVALCFASASWNRIGGPLCLFMLWMASTSCKRVEVGCTYVGKKLPYPPYIGPKFSFESSPSKFSRKSPRTLSILLSILFSNNQVASN